MSGTAPSPEAAVLRGDLHRMLAAARAAFPDRPDFTIAAMMLAAAGVALGTAFFPAKPPDDVIRDLGGLIASGMLCGADDCTTAARASCAGSA